MNTENIIILTFLLMIGPIVSYIVYMVYNKKLYEKEMNIEDYNSTKNTVENAKISTYVFTGIIGLYLIYSMYKYLVSKTPVVPTVHQHTNSIVTQESFFRPDTAGIARAKRYI